MKKKVAKKVGKVKKPGKPTSAEKPGKVAANTPFRAGSNYALVYDAVVKMAKDKAVSRKELVKAVCKLNGKDEKHVNFDFAVVLSPNQQGGSHKGARQAARFYYIERIKGGLLKLHLR